MALFTKKSSSVLPCEPSLVYEALTDYDSYSEWMPHMVKSKLLAKEGDLAIAEFELHGKKMAVECVHSRNQMVLGRAISGDIPISKLEWKLAPAGEGTQVSLTIEASPHWSWLFPASWGLLNPAAYLNSLRSYISVFAPDLVLSDAQGEKILELLETENGPVLWFRGKEYLLQEAAGGKR